jgi:hypothetical protein
MSNAAQEAEESNPPDKVVTLRIQESLNSKVDDAVKATGLKKADVIRLAIERGVDVLLSQLLAPTGKASPVEPTTEAAP